MTPELLFLITFIHESPDVRAGIAQFAEANEADVGETLEKTLPAVEQALLGGLLEVG
jgi:hypothetical protein